MGHWRNIPDRCYRNAACLQSAHRSFTTATRTFDDHFDFFQTMFRRFPGGCLRSDLGRKRRRLFRTLESASAARRPRNSISLRVRDRNDRIIERGRDMDDPFRDVLGLLFRFHYWFRRHLCFPFTYHQRRTLNPRHYVFVGAFFLAMVCLIGPFRVRAFVWVRCPRTGRPRRCRKPR